MSDSLTRARHRRSAYLLFILAAALFLVIGVMWQQATAKPAHVVRAALDGLLAHNFGTVDLGSNDGTLEHVFRLKNTTDMPIRLLQVSPTCGCLVAAADEDLVLPGAEISVRATLHLLEVGHKSAQIMILTDHDRSTPQVLSLVARGWRARQLSSLTHHLTLASESIESLVVYFVDHDSGIAPAQPTLMISDGFVAQWGEWRSVQALSPSEGLPARWEASLSVHRSSTPTSTRGGIGAEIHATAVGRAAPASAAQLVIELPEVSALRVRLDTP